MIILLIIEATLLNLIGICTIQANIGQLNPGEKNLC